MRPVRRDFACRLFRNSGNLSCSLDFELVRRVSRTLWRDSTNSRSTPRGLLYGAYSAVAGMAGSSLDAHGDADAVVEIDYGLAHSHASTASSNGVKSKPFVFVVCALVIVCSQVIPAVHSVSWASKRLRTYVP
jgi:hypothetical protein